MFSRSSTGRQIETGVAVAITALFLTVPAVIVGLGWLYCLVPLPVYYFLNVYGQKQGTFILVWAIGLASGMTIWSGNLSSLLFSLTLLPIGFILARADKENKPTQQTGVKSVSYLVLVWLLSGWLFGLATQSNPYLELRQSIDKGFEATLALYRDSGHFQAGDLAELQVLIAQIRQQVARLFPALLFISVICTVWLNIVLGQWLLRKRNSSRTDREELKNWRLPELLVWLVILTGFALLTPHNTINTLGLNTGLVLLVLYLSQGLAVVSSLMQKWSLPLMIRIITYNLLFLQVYGIVFIAALGLADVWIDFRRKRLENDADDISVS